MKNTPIPALAALFLAGLAPAPASAQAAPAAATRASTRDLSHFRRDDAAPNGVTRITLDADRVAARPLSQDVFGNFIENLGTVIYDALWADALHNPQIERLQPGDVEAPWWNQTGAAAWEEDAGSGYRSQRCERLSAPNGALGAGTLSQRVFLPATRTRGYTLTLWAHAPDGPGRVTAALRTGGEGDGVFQPGFETAGAAIAQSAFAVSGTGWRKQTLRWALPAGAVPKGRASRLVLAHAGGKPVDVDDVRLTPDDAVEGFDPDAIRAARAWHIPVLRWAGNYSSGYNWHNGVGPRDARPTFVNYAWGGVESNDFGTDEFLTLARLVGAPAQIGVNAGDGTPELAADWVRYCATRPAPNAGRVALWEVGNELYGGWQIGHTDAPGNADRFVRFRRAMRAADPALRVMATGRGDEFDADGLARARRWNGDVLRAAVADGGAPPFLTVHPLVALPGGLAGRPYGEIYESAMAQPAFVDTTEIPALIQTIQSAEGPDAPTRIAPTEWGIILGGDGWQRGPNRDTEAGAVFNALTLNAFLRNGDWVTLANMTAFLHGGGIKKDRGVVYTPPEYYAQKLYADARPFLPIGTDWDGPARDVPARGQLPAVRDVSDVDAFSALTEDRARLVAFLVNRREGDARPVHLDVSGFAAGARSATILTALDPQAANSWDHPEAVRPAPFALPTPNADGSTDFTLPPHSLVVLTLRRR